MKASLDPPVAPLMALRQRPRNRDVRGHSRFVQRARWALPALAAGLLLLVVAWPQLDAVIDRIHFAVPRIDISDAGKLRMVNLRYSGIDRENRPYVVTAESATQAPPPDEIVSMDGPKADMTTASGNWVEVTGDVGTYQAQPQLLELYGNVELYQDRGNDFHTDSAHVDILNGTAEGHDPITGQGPFGHIVAEGFTMYNRGDVILFTGKANLTLLPRPKAAE